MEIAIYLAVADDVFDGVFFVLSVFPRDVLDEIWGLTESVSEGFLSYSIIHIQYCLEFVECFLVFYYLFIYFR